MKKQIYICDICNKEIPSTSFRTLELPFVIDTEEGPGMEFKQTDVCLDCCFKIANFLKENNCQQ